MTIDLDIVPLRPAPPTWGALRRQWANGVGQNAFALLGPDPQLRRLGGGTLLRDDEELAPMLQAYFVTTAARTLSLSVAPNGGNVVEHEYLEDYGRNVEPSAITEMADQWRRVGYSYEIHSGGGRSATEPELFIALAAALGYLCDGRVIVMNHDVFDVSVGIYTPAEFARSRWLRKREDQALDE